jgi:hypothetical protein
VLALREGEYLDADAGVGGCLDQALDLPGHDARDAFPEAARGDRGAARIPLVVTGLNTAPVRG